MTRMMPLADIVVRIPGAAPGGAAVAVGGIAVDSRKVRPGDLFVALRGAKADGHDFLGAAAAAGAAAALVDRDVAAPPLPCVRVPSTADALVRAAVAFHADPSSRLKVIGVTGTNGKTTVTYLLESIVSAAGGRPAVIGTISYRLGGAVLRSGLTTPFPHELQEVMADALAGGATHVVMEVSSHSTAQGRVGGVRFDAGLFTNLSHDHLDYHGDMESYFEAKALLFRKFLPAGGKTSGMAFNADDPYGRRLAAEYPAGLAFGTSPGLPVHPLAVEMTWAGTVLRLRTPAGPLELRTRLIGGYNISNVMAAASGALLLGLPAEAVVGGIEALRAIPGRIEEIPNGRGLHVFVDYAHTPDGLDRLLAALRELAPARLITVFGCGGNRDRAKRPAMGRIAATRSNVVIVTSDNPRNEDTRAIIAEILPGVRSARLAEGAEPAASGRGVFEVIPDRREAIARALELARPGDTIAIAGKGHENVQIIGDRSVPFDDREEVRRLLGCAG